MSAATVSFNEGDELVRKFVSPEYFAVISHSPTGRLEVVNVATPLLLSVAVPKGAPLLKVTVPVGVPAVELTVAVKVTDLPNAAGFRFDCTAVVLFARLTYCENVLEVVAGQNALAGKLAVMRFWPTTSPETGRFAAPWTELLVPKTCPPSTNVTSVPSGGGP